jgi:pilus assembly protein CpaF
MFGKRSTSAEALYPRPVAPEAPVAPPPQSQVTAPPAPAPRAEPKPEPAPAAALKPAKSERKPVVERTRSEEYYDVKTTVFNALPSNVNCGASVLTC